MPIKIKINYNMEISEKAKKVIDIIQWILIALSIAACIFIYRWNGKLNSSNITQTKNERYIKIYDSQKISELEKENKNLYDSIKKLNGVNSAIEIRYKYKYSTDTVYLANDKYIKDSLYVYTYNNDTIYYKLSLLAKDLKWYQEDFEINDKFTLYNKEDGEKITTIIDHSPNMEIEGTTMWKKKKTFKERFFYGPSIGAGFGILNKNFDIFIGGTVGFDLSD